MSLTSASSAFAQPSSDKPADSAAPTSPATSSSTPAPTVPADLQQRIDEIDQRSRIIERKLELADEKSAEKAKESPVSAAGPGGFSIRSADKAHEVKIRGLLQFDVRRFFDDQTLEDRDTLLLRKVRPQIDATFLGIVDARLVADFAGSAASLVDAYIDLRPKPYLRLLAGKFKPPIGLERLQSDVGLPFIERALDANLTPARDVGIQLHGDIEGVVSYAIGIYNGGPGNGNLDVDTNHAKDFGGRLFIQPFKLIPEAGLGNLGIGFAATTGNQKGTATAPGLPAFRTNGQVNFFTYRSDMNNVVLANLRHTRINPHLYYYVGPFGLLGEYVRSRQEIIKGAEVGALNHASWHASANFVLGADATWEGVNPKKPLDLDKGTLGALELAARYEWLDVDDASFEEVTPGDAATEFAARTAASATKAQAVVGAVNWYWSRNVRASVNYSHTWFEGGAAVNASNPEGNRKTEKLILGRLQAAF